MVSCRGTSCRYRRSQDTWALESRTKTNGKLRAIVPRTIGNRSPQSGSRGGQTRRSHSERVRVSDYEGFDQF